MKPEQIEKIWVKHQGNTHRTPEIDAFIQELLDAQLEALPKEMKLIDIRVATDDTLTELGKAYKRGYGLGATDQLITDQLVQDKKRAELEANGKRAWYILDTIAVRHSGTHQGSGNAPCFICDRAEEAMRLLQKPNHEECHKMYQDEG
jgi:hypothetical protein